MAQSVRKRKQATINFSINNKISDDLHTGMVYRELYLHLQGAVTATALQNVYADVQRGDEWGVVKRIDIRANGTDVIKSFSGNELRWINYFIYGVKPPVTVGLGDGSVNPAFSTVLILPFWMPRAIHFMDTALDARKLSSLEVEVTWGTFTDIISSGTAWTTEPTLEIYSAESFNIAGPFSQWRIFSIEKEITATNPRFQIKLPVGHMYRGFLINTTDAGVDDGDVINNFKLISGTTVYADLSEEILDVERQRRALPRGFSGVAYDDLFMGNDNSVNGWYYYDHVMDGFLSEAIDTIGFSEFLMELDVTVGGGTTKVIVLPQEIVPVRGGG